MTRLELGGGLAAAPGHTNIDIIKSADIVWDLNKGLPSTVKSKDPYVEGIRCHQLLEHLTDIIPLFNDCYKVMKEGADFEISTPYALSEEGWGDPTHKRCYTPSTFSYFIDGSPFEKERKEYGITCKFKLIYARIANGWNVEALLQR